MNKTIEGLIEFFSNYQRVCVAYTCGMENPILVRAALEAGCDVMAVIAVTPMVKASEVEYMGGVLSNIYREIHNGYIAHMNMNIEPENKIRSFSCVKLENDVLDISGVCENAANRCYHCKKAVISRIIYLARKSACDILADSTYFADKYQIRATDYLGVVNPLHFIPHKQIMHDLADEGIYGKFFAKQCLADGYLLSARISADGLRLVEGVENVLNEFGLTGAQFKIHDDLIRIKGERGGLNRLSGTDINSLNKKLTGLGLAYVTMDLDEYRAG